MEDEGEFFSHGFARMGTDIFWGEVVLCSGFWHKRIEPQRRKDRKGRDFYNVEF
jgi:hypothetical protein